MKFKQQGWSMLGIGLAAMGRTGCIVFIWLLARAAAADVPMLYRPAPALTAAELAVVVNDADALSRQIGEYYAQRRQIPAENVIHVEVPRKAILSKLEFKEIMDQVAARTPQPVQAYLLTWTQPYRVECMSITTAFAAGFDPAFCARPCAETRKSPYYASETAKPYTSLGWRPTMMLAAANFTDARNLIDTGVVADYSHPQGVAYLLQTPDKARNTRARTFPEIVSRFRGFWPVEYLQQNDISGKSDVMFYFTGLSHVPHIADNRYLPGAVADHLTSSGGVLSGSDQTSVLEWLKAGVTASYGAVVEPCNYPAKFANPSLLMYFYLRGSSVLEAYWKSVAEPGQGLFVGEPLARPFAYPSGNLPLPPLPAVQPAGLPQLPK